MEVYSQLGLEPELNFEAINVMQYDEDGGSSLLSVVEKESSQDSLESRTSTTNFRSSTTAPLMQPASDLLMAVSVSADVSKRKISDLACAVMEELTRMALEGKPLWYQRQEHGNQHETLNGFEYMKEFASIDATLEEIMRMVEVGDSRCLLSLGTDDEIPIGGEDHDFRPIMPQEFQEQNSHSEASREIGFVSMNPITIVGLLMDVNQWLVTFSNMVTRATLLGVLSTGVQGSYDGSLQVLRVEYHLPTALVPSRETCLSRYCKKLAPMTWGVVDVSVEDVFFHPSAKFQRRPSGCLIQEMPDGSSKVTWVEHAAVKGVVHSMYRPLVVSGFAFGAKRWVASLITHSQWLATLSATTTPTLDGVLIPQAGRESLLRLSERMRRSFWGDISGSSGNMWMTLPTNGAEDIRVMMRGNLRLPGKSPVTTIVFTTSIWLPVPPKRAFDFLRDENYRNQWDIRLSGRSSRELAYIIINGENPDNRVSILQVNATPEKIEMLYLQETHHDRTGCHVIYAPVDLPTMSRILNGGDPDNVHILGCGFAILPDRPVSDGSGEGVCGSLLTMAFHLIDKASMEEYIPPESLSTICSIITNTALLIRNALTP